MSTDNVDRLKLNAGLILNGLLAICGLWFQWIECFYVLACLATLDIVVGYRYLPTGLLVAMWVRAFRLQPVAVYQNIPNRDVLRFNAFMTALMALLSAKLMLIGSIYAWLPASAVAALSLLSGTSGFCPVALSFSFLQCQWKKAPPGQER